MGDRVGPAVADGVGPAVVRAAMELAVYNIGDEANQDTSERVPRLCLLTAACAPGEETQSGAALAFSPPVPCLLKNTLD